MNALAQLGRVVGATVGIVAIRVAQATERLPLPHKVEEPEEDASDSANDKPEVGTPIANLAAWVRNLLHN